MPKRPSTIKAKPAPTSARPAGRASAQAPTRSWRQKLADDKGFPKVCTLDAKKSERMYAKTMVLPAPREVDEVMRRVRKGRLATLDQIRTLLAQRHGADTACPLLVGIFAWIAANAAEEDAAAGRKTTTPYWRTLKARGELNPKWPGGISALRRRLAAEGHDVIQRGKRFFVVNFADRLAEIADK